jgi:acyl dehydratase
MGALALAGLGRRRDAVADGPGPLVERRIPPRPDPLIDAYVAHVGAPAAAYARTVPPHFFPQWALALSGDLMRGLRYPFLRAMNGGCRLEAHGELPRGEPLLVRGRLASIDDDGRRAVLIQRYTTGTARDPEILAAEVRIVVLRARSRGGERKDPPRAPETAREIGRFWAGPRAGFEFALLTGDFNPVHWLAPWARANGFPGPILHGFSTFARAWEIARRHGTVRALDARLTRPLVLPADARVLAEDDRIWIVDARDVAVMEGRIER